MYRFNCNIPGGIPWLSLCLDRIWIHTKWTRLDCPYLARLTSPDSPQWKTSLSWIEADQKLGCMSTSTVVKCINAILQIRTWVGILIPYFGDICVLDPRVWQIELPQSLIAFFCLKEIKKWTSIYLGSFLYPIMIDIYDVFAQKNR